MQYNGPAVLPWLWQPVEIDGDVVLVPQPIPHTAGPSGDPFKNASWRDHPMSPLLSITWLHSLTPFEYILLRLVNICRS